MAAKFFTGAFPKPLDEKFRLQIPKEMQRVIEAEQGENRAMYVLLGEDRGSLTLYTESGFEEQASRISTEFMTTQEARQFELAFYSQAHQVTADGQWRFVLPEQLRTRAGLKDQVILAGRKRRIDVYTPQTYELAMAGKLDEEGWPNWTKFLRMAPQQEG